MLRCEGVREFQGQASPAPAVRQPSAAPFLTSKLLLSHETGSFAPSCFHYTLLPSGGLKAQIID